MHSLCSQVQCVSQLSIAMRKYHKHLMRKKGSFRVAWHCGDMGIMV